MFINDVTQPGVFYDTKYEGLSKTDNLVWHRGEGVRTFLHFLTSWQTMLGDWFLKYVLKSHCWLFVLQGRNNLEVH